MARLHPRQQAVLRSMPPSGLARKSSTSSSRLVAIVAAFELLGRVFIGDSFLFNTRDNVDAIFNQQRLEIIILQVSIVGIIAVGVTQVIITGGIDLSSGSVVAATAMIAMSFAQVAPIRVPSSRA